MTDYNFQPKGFRSSLGWYSRNLPHFDGGEICQFLTARLFDSLPAEILERAETKFKIDGDSSKHRRRIEKYLDSGHGRCFLKNPKIAKLVQDSLLFHHGTKFKLFAWVIMPNHIHVLLKPAENIDLAEIGHSIKSYSAHEANRMLRRTGQFWQHETFDRYIRNRKHFLNAIRYIENNPVKSRLCKSSEHWQFSSAYFRANDIDF